MRDVSAAGVGRNLDGGDTGAVAEEIERLNVSGVVVAAAFVHGHDDGGARPPRWSGLDAVDDLFHEALDRVELGRCRVSIAPSARLYEPNAGGRPPARHATTAR